MQRAAILLAATLALATPAGLAQEDPFADDEDPFADEEDPFEKYEQQANNVSNATSELAAGEDDGGDGDGDDGSDDGADNGSADDGAAASETNDAPGPGVFASLLALALAIRCARQPS